MKIIHCADIHLDSKMTSNLSSEKAKERKYEILQTFLGMIAYGADHGVKAVVIAGDLFDTKNITVGTRNAVLDAITTHPDMDFYYLQGNHGGGNVFLDGIPKPPENLKLFGEEWTAYTLYASEKKRIVLSGIELTEENAGQIYSSLVLDPRDFNIVTLHGQLGVYEAKSPESIGLNELKGKNIDYLALGHVHEYQEGKLAPRGVYCYCGCLEGRGFDECGKHGFVLLDIDEETFECAREVVDISRRTIHELHVDISDCMNTPEIQRKLEEEFPKQQCAAEDLVKVILEGKLDVNCEKNTEFLAKWLRDCFYYAKLKDETKIEVDYNDYILEASLKGEFVRLIKGDDTLTEDEKAELIRCGFQALSEEEIEI